MLEATFDLQSNVHDRMEAAYNKVIDLLRAAYPDTMIFFSVESAPPQAASMAKHVILNRRDPLLNCVGSVSRGTISKEKVVMEGVRPDKMQKERLCSMVANFLSTGNIRIARGCIFHTDRPLKFGTKTFEEPQKFLEQYLRRQMLNIRKTDKGISGKFNGINDDLHSALTLSLSLPSEIVGRRVCPVPLRALHWDDLDFDSYKDVDWGAFMSGEIADIKHFLQDFERIPTGY